MSTETQTTQKINPTIAYVEIDHGGHISHENWEFLINFSETFRPTWENLTIPSLGTYSGTDRPKGLLQKDKLTDIRYIAAHRDGEWVICRAIQRPSSDYTYIHVLEEDQRLIDKMAFPIDPKMKKIDIEGAINIYPNETNTGWLFEHCSVETHYDRILEAEVAMSTLFDELIHDKLTTLLVSFIQGHSKSNQLGEATILEHIELFRDDCKKMTRYREGQLYIGQHIQESGDHYIYKMVQEAFKLAKKKWTVEKSAELNQISDHIAPIEKRLNSRHNFKRRWEIPVVFPDAETQISAEESSGS